jgi:hypothetical protein
MFEPLFEECNRTRRLIAQMARHLSVEGLSLHIVALPGTGESLTEIADVRLVDWQEAARAEIAALKPTVIASIRGGALIDAAGEAKGRWRFAPESGARLVRDLRRTQLAGEGTKLYAGNALSEAFLAELEGMVPVPLAPLRTVRLESDLAECDLRVAGSPLWRRAEPGEDPALALALATDLAEWTHTCAAF